MIEAIAPPTWRIVLDDFEPPSLNTWLSRHWRKRYGDKQFIEQLVLCCAPHSIPRPIVARVGVWVTVYNRSRSIDVDNVPLKAIIDGLRYAMILDEDDAKHLKWCGLEWETDKNGPRVVIDIYEA